MIKHEFTEVDSVVIEDEDSWVDIDIRFANGDGWSTGFAVADADRQEKATQQAVALEAKDAEIERLMGERNRKSAHVRRLLDDIRGLTQRAETAERELADLKARTVV